MMCGSRGDEGVNNWGDSETDLAPLIMAVFGFDEAANEKAIIISTMTGQGLT